MNLLTAVIADPHLEVAIWSEIDDFAAPVLVADNVDSCSPHNAQPNGKIRARGSQCRIRPATSSQQQGKDFDVNEYKKDLLRLFDDEGSQLERLGRNQLNRYGTNSDGTTCGKKQWFLCSSHKPEHLAKLSRQRICEECVYCRSCSG